MNKLIQKIENDIQDRTSPAWLKLLEYIDIVHIENRDEFSPLEFLGKDLFAQIYTLPQEIGKLKGVKKMWLYGSSLKRIPPEIGEMSSLEYFDVYTSYKLHWFPYEIAYCKNLKDSRVSTRATYGNFKNKMAFPQLNSNPIRSSSEYLSCSICKKTIDYNQTNQLWISLVIGTDVMPLLVNSCSAKCEALLPKPPEGYIQFAHKGGSELQQPNLDEWDYIDMISPQIQNSDEPKPDPDEQKPDEKMPLLKLIRKIWDK